MEVTMAIYFDYFHFIDIYLSGLNTFTKFWIIHVNYITNEYLQKRIFFEPTPTGSGRKIDI